MSVKIIAYKVHPNPRKVDVDLEISLPTGVVCSTITASEETISAAAAAADREIWDERDLVTVVADVFMSLAGTVKV